MSTDDEITRDSLPKFQKSSQNEKRQASVDPLIRAVEIGKRFLVEGHPPPIPRGGEDSNSSSVLKNQVDTKTTKKINQNFA